ncbi:MAG TPA: branched-chain amino acid ABC transporter permease [Thermodesulfobacteriota bacterium]|nr:branched-chain amino acid ABC transporter permease [Thermodesulfobacteriota bacterium]
MLLDKGKSIGFILIFSLILLIFIALPFFIDLFYQTFLTELFIWILFAISFDLIFGYTGLLSFGQALFFGLGGYSVAIAIMRFGLNSGIGLLLSVIVPILFAWLVGYFSVKLTGIHFVIITIIFALIGSTLGETWTWLTGGADGLNFLPPPIRLGLFQIDVMDIKNNYYLVLFFAATTYLFLRRMVHSPLGKVFISIRENEDRARLIGYNVQRYKLLSFVIAGGLSGLAGGLYSLTLKYASAGFLHWSISGHAVVYTIVGGMGTLMGAVLGAGIVMSLEHYLINFLQATDLVVGIVLVAMVLMAPKGLVGLIQSKLKRKEASA